MTEPRYQSPSIENTVPFTDGVSSWGEIALATTIAGRDLADMVGQGSGT